MKCRFVLNPPVKTYQSNAYVLGAVLALGPAANGILDNNFLSWECFPNLKDSFRPIMFLPFFSPSNFSACRLGLQLSFKPNDQIELYTAISSSLEQGFLVRLLVDEYYIPDRWAYGKRHWVHDVLITDATSGIGPFEMIGYCSDDRYRVSACSPTELSEGYFSAIEAVEKTKEVGFVAFKAQLQQPILIEPKEIKRQLGCFLKSKDPHPRVQERSLNREPKILYGLDIYEAYEMYVRNLAENDSLDRRIFSIVTEHSQMMLRRTMGLESLFGIVIEKNSMRQATQLASRLQLLSLLPKHRRSNAIYAEMGRLCRELKDESRKAGEILWMGIDQHG